MLTEHPRDGGRLRHRARGDGNVAVVRLVERLFDDAVAVGVQDQIVHHADAQPALDHREDGEVAADLKLDARGLPEMLEEQIDLVVLLLLEADEILVRQPADGEAFRVAQRVVRRQDDRQRVAQQEGRVELLGAGEGEKAAVDLPAAQPGRDLVVLAVEDLKADIGVFFVEGLDHQRHPAGRHAGERAHANEAALQSVQLADGKIELLLPLDDGLKDGQQLRPLRADLDARAVAREQRDIPMLLQVRDHAAHGRLRVAQLRGGEHYHLGGDTDVHFRVIGLRGDGGIVKDDDISRGSLAFRRQLYLSQVPRPPGKRQDGVRLVSRDDAVFQRLEICRGRAVSRRVDQLSHCLVFDRPRWIEGAVAPCGGDGLFYRFKDHFCLLCGLIRSPYNNTPSGENNQVPI